MLRKTYPVILPFIACARKVYNFISVMTLMEDALKNGVSNTSLEPLRIHRHKDKESIA
jgi:hypothetical protein